MVEMHVAYVVNNGRSIGNSIHTCSAHCLTILSAHMMDLIVDEGLPRKFSSWPINKTMIGWIGPCKVLSQHQQYFEKIKGDLWEKNTKGGLCTNKDPEKLWKRRRSLSCFFDFFFCHFAIWLILTIMSCVQQIRQLQVGENLTDRLVNINHQG